MCVEGLLESAWRDVSKEVGKIAADSMCGVGGKSTHSVAATAASADPMGTLYLGWPTPLQPVIDCELNLD